MQAKIISFWSPVSRSGCSTNAALFISYLSKTMDEMNKAVLFSLNYNIDSTDYLTNICIKEGIKNLKFLNSNGGINTKEDVFAYTHKISENVDVLGTDKDINEIIENFDLMIEILSKSYDYIILDVPSGMDDISLKSIASSTIVVINLPQDKYICQEFISRNIKELEDKKSMLLISQFDVKRSFSKDDIEVILQRDIYTINNDVKINQSCYEKTLFSYLNKKTSTINELDNLYKEVERLINIDTLNITYDINKFNNENTNKVAYKSLDEPIKVVKEYKFIKAKNNIGIINLSEGAGATFVTLNLACLLKEKKLDVTVAEITYNKKHDIYSIFNCDGAIPYIIDGVKYYINNNNQDEWTDEKIIEYINSINKESATINLYDLGNMSLLDNSINYLLNLLDCCIVVVDPLPYKLLQSNCRNEMILHELSNKGVESIYIANKFIDDLNKKDIENYLNCKIVSCIPFIKPTTMYAAHYVSKNVYKIEKNELFKDSLLKIIDRANIAIDLERKRKNIFDIFRKGNL